MARASRPCVARPSWPRLAGAQRPQCDRDARARCPRHVQPPSQRSQGFGTKPTCLSVSSDATKRVVSFTGHPTSKDRQTQGDLADPTHVIARSATTKQSQSAGWEGTPNAMNHVWEPRLLRSARNDISGGPIERLGVRPASKDPVSFLRLGLSLGGADLVDRLGVDVPLVEIDQLIGGEVLVIGIVELHDELHRHVVVVQFDEFVQ